MYDRCNYTIPNSDLPILIDCDGVLSNFSEAVARVAIRKFNKKFENTDWHSFKQIEGLEDAINDAILRDRFVYNMREMVNGISWLRHVEKTFGADRVFICTSPWNENWMNERAHWLIKHGVPLERQIQVKRKHLVPGYLVDDAEKNFVANAEKGIPARPANQSFLLAREWNKPVEGIERGNYMDAFAWLKQNVAT
jgi:hypothetical protein